MRRFMLAAAVAVLAIATASAATAQPAPLIERTKLFGNPTKAAGRLN